MYTSSKAPLHGAGIIYLMATTCYANIITSQSIHTFLDSSFVCKSRKKLMPNITEIKHVKEKKILQNRGSIRLSQSKAIYITIIIIV